MSKSATSNTTLKMKSLFTTTCPTQTLSERTPRYEGSTGDSVNLNNRQFPMYNRYRLKTGKQFATTYFPERDTVVGIIQV